MLGKTAARAVLAAVLATSIACRTPDEAAERTERGAAKPAPAVPRGEAPRAAARTRTEAKEGVQDAGAEGAAAALVERLAGSAVTGVRPISPRSLSVKVALASGDRAVWKPFRKTNRTARYEVAYSKIAPLIGAPSVPASALRRLSLAQVAGLLDVSYPDAAAALREGALVDDHGLVGGAVIAWIDDLGPPRFEGETGWKQLAERLAPDGPSAAAEPSVAAASRMVVADYVAGSWDRFSGGNLFADASGRGLWLIDNNGSFAPWSDRQRDRMEGQLAACARFSASQIERLRALTAGSVRAALAGEEARGVVDRVLTDDEITLLLARRDAAIRKVDAEIAARGLSVAVVFP
jgi:hypothetical protein